MSLQPIGASAPTAELRPQVFPLTAAVFAELLARDEEPSREARIELLDAAFVVTYERLGCPLNDAAEAEFDRQLDSLYRASLVARRPARLRQTTAMRLRAICLADRGMR